MRPVEIFLMLFQVDFCGKQLLALAAGICLLPGVHWLVSPQLLMCSKGFVTAGAGNWPGHGEFPGCHNVAEAEGGFRGYLFFGATDTNRALTGDGHQTEEAEERHNRHFFSW